MNLKSPHNLHKFTLHDRLLVFNLAFLARVIILFWEYSQKIDTFRWSSDSWEYMSSMMAIRAGDWGHYMFTLRTPGYPLALAGFNALFGLTPPQMTAWLPFQATLTALGILLATHIIFRLTHNRSLTLICGILLAIDPIILGAETPILSESLFNPALIVAQLFLLRWLKNHRLRDFIISVVSLQTMVLLRPVGTYILIIFVIVILLYNWRLWKYSLAMIILFSLPILIWTARNIHYTGINAYSTATVYNLLFYKDVSTESLVTGKSPNDLAWDYALEIETRLGDPSKLDTRYFPVGNYTYLYVDDVARYRVMSDMAYEKLSQFHLWHFVKLPYSVLKTFLSNETLQQLIPKAIIWLITIISFCIIPFGIWQVLHEKYPLWQYALIFGIIAYFVFGSAFILPGNTASRYLSPMMVYWELLLVKGIQYLVQLSSRRWIKRN